MLRWLRRGFPADHNFRREILRTAKKKLGRQLTADERRFVTSRTGLMALEMILETVRTSSPEEIERYLNSEPQP